MRAPNTNGRPLAVVAHPLCATAVSRSRFGFPPDDVVAFTDPKPEAAEHLDAPRLSRSNPVVCSLPGGLGRLGHPPAGPVCAVTNRRWRAGN